MAILARNLNLSTVEDQRTLLEQLTAAGVALDPAVLQHALTVLSEDWLQLAGDMCSLKVGTKHSETVSLTTWLNIIYALYDFRHHKDFATQVHRLRIPSHEKLDTALVVLIARRYHLRGFAIMFEPFGSGSTDLLLSRDAYRLYAEVKRENLVEHRRLLRMQELGGLINAALNTALRDWLREHHLRIEIRISKLFSNPHASKLVEEICALASNNAVGVESTLQSVSGSQMIILPEDAEFFYRKGLHAGFVRVEAAGKPVPILAPASSPIRCTFGLGSNLKALGGRIRDAGKQLARDLKRDEKSDGVLILECAFVNEEVIDAIRSRFWSRLPQRCWGITVLSNSSWVIPRTDLSTAQIEVLSYAAPAAAS